MSLNFLNLNESKPEANVFGPLAISGSTNHILGSLASCVNPSVIKLGVVFDKQVNAVVKSSFFQLRLLDKVKNLFIFSEFKGIKHAFINTFLK